MTKVLIVHADDSIAVSTVFSDDVAAAIAKTEQSYLNSPEIANKAPFKSWRIIDESEIPADRSYRNAWRDTGAGIEHDMTRARDLHKDKLRREREPKLEALDVEYQRADEQGDNQKKQQIAAQKQALRDITKDPRIAAAKTIEQLKLVIV